ncbi:hypothetical protein C4568_03825 [Candidatus Parcubacteria bacterium]|nr:MAG: hypothetical protein C4568_03825 [Candidatus Parcubacteria bacterium]
MADNLERVKEVLARAAKTVEEEKKFARYEDVERFFTVLTDVVRAIEPKLADELSTKLEKALKNESSALSGRVSDLQGEIRDAEKRMKKLLSEAQHSTGREREKMVERHQKELNKLVEGFAKTLKNIQKEAEEYATVDDVVGFVQRAIEQITGEDIRDQLESLKGEERLDKSAIKGLDEELAEIRKTKSGSSGPSGITGKDVIQKYDLSPYLDGVTKTFAIPGNWTVLDVSGTSSPYQFRRLVDYTFTNQAITFTDQVDAAGSLAEGQTVEILYVIG